MSQLRITFILMTLSIKVQKLFAIAQGRAHVVALGGVVVDHVEDDLDARRVHGLDHGLELLDLLAVLGVYRLHIADIGEALFDFIVRWLLCR